MATKNVPETLPAGEGGLPCPIDRFPNWVAREAVSDYQDGCAHGNTAAAVYLQYLKGEDTFSGGTLQHMAFEYCRRLGHATMDEERDAIRGQMVGFFSTLDGWLKFAVTQGTGPALRLTSDEIKAALADAVEGGPKRRFDTRTKEIFSQQARKAANARWAAHRKAKETAVIA